MNLIDELESRVVCGDGAMGTLLLDRGHSLERCLEELCVSEPDRVREIHGQYIAAGARLIETNTFGANAVRLERFGLEERVAEINAAGVKLARAAAHGKDVYVAGSVGPLGITADEAEAHGIDRGACFREQITALRDGGVRIVLFETFMDFEEMEIAVRAAPGDDLLAICCFACAPEGRLSSGMLLVDAFERVRRLGAKIVGANCMNGPHGMVQLLQRIPAGELLAAYPNAGYPKYTDGRFIYHTAPEYFANSAREMVAEGARLVGGCCGTNPQHISAIAKAIADLQPVRSKRIRVSVEPAPPKRSPRPVAPGEESLLERMESGKRVIICELDPPKTLALDKYFAGAQALVEAGCDAITLADNSLAILRVSNLAIGAILKERYGITPLLHLSCRDRNVLGLQSELLGMAAMGMRHVLPLTGDPSKVGDHPGASSVYDVSSIELIGIVKRLNEGFNQAGKSIKSATNFVVGCTFNPNAKNLEAQINRLERKVAAGARFVMTQPVFDVRLIQRMYQSTKHIGIPIFTGIWPLLSGRQAEFLHNEVPGIVVPQEVRDSMAGSEGLEGRERGVALAKEVAEAVLEYYSGVYLITPFLNYETTVEVARFVRALEPATVSHG